MTLARAPAHVVGPDGMPHLGRFEGQALDFGWSRLQRPYRRGGVWRHFHHKRWHYVALSTADFFCAVAIVDIGWTNTAFAYAFDRRARKVVAALSRDGLPGLTAQVGGHAGADSSFRFLGERIAVRATGQGEFALELRCRQFEIDAQYGGDAPLLLAVGEVAGGSVHATQKSSALALSGFLKIGAAHHALDGGVASFDYSNGLLARRTAWRWASAHGPQVGFNLQAGYFGANENALWLDGQLIALGAARFDFTPDDPLAPWHITTDDGLLDLHFRPEGARREDKNLLIAASRYIQPIGTFSGWVKAAPHAPARQVTQLVGVTEDHASVW
ncbi:MAG: DUF2804 domain-containing protein [Pseudomonadota bacterium]